MKSFVIRKWWRQLFVVAKQEQRMQEEAGGGDCIASAWRMHVARKLFRLAWKRHVIKSKTLAASVVQRSIKSHAARVALKAAAAAAAAAANERALVKALAYEVTVAAGLFWGMKECVAWCQCSRQVSSIQRKESALQEQSHRARCFRASAVINRQFPTISKPQAPHCLNPKPLSFFVRACKFFYCGVVFRRKQRAVAAAAAIAKRERMNEEAAGVLQRVWR
jgi:hypothetical protein